MTKGLTVATAEQIRVPETLLKKRKDQERIASEKAAALVKKRKAAKTRRVIFKRAETYVKEYIAAERHEIRLRRQAKAKGNYYHFKTSKTLQQIALKYQPHPTQAAQDSSTLASPSNQ
ncbi:13929_t:CDS:2 [Acaulospora colombiana]|uniref:13929_t:CDS:1 n=1 Tax=Acaulospora colombiana TaxID=27376 RepID=A0ACA9LVG0_9GLOM|nr:13929_t:CDS:2 [Acaulospora colombiana]